MATAGVPHFGWIFANAGGRKRSSPPTKGRRDAVASHAPVTPTPASVTRSAASVPIPGSPAFADAAAIALRDARQAARLARGQSHEEARRSCEIDGRDERAHDEEGAGQVAARIADLVAEERRGFDSSEREGDRREEEGVLEPRRGDELRRRKGRRRAESGEHDGARDDEENRRDPGRDSGGVVQPRAVLEAADVCQ